MACAIKVMITWPVPFSLSLAVFFSGSLSLPFAVGRNGGAGPGRGARGDIGMSTVIGVKTTNGSGGAGDLIGNPVGPKLAMKEVFKQRSGCLA